MFSFLGPLLSMAVSFAEAHPDIVKALWTEVTSVINAHGNHPSPTSVEAVTALHAGIAAAAASAITSAAARMKAQAIPVPVA